MRTTNILKMTSLVVLLGGALVWTGCQWGWQPRPIPTGDSLPRFQSDDELVAAFKQQQQEVEKQMQAQEEAATGTGAPAAAERGGAEYSETNVQVGGVDEADIVKTDGQYIYALAQGNLNITRAYPVDTAALVSTVKLDEFQPQEMFIGRDKLLIFGSEDYTMPDSQPGGVAPYYQRSMSVRIYNVSDRTQPELLRQVYLEGDYLSSRKIGDDVYFVVNTYPYLEENYTCSDLVPRFFDNSSDKKPSDADMKPLVGCTEVGYIEPLRAESFLTVASLSLADVGRPLGKEVIVGSGSNVYASAQNLYVAQTSWPNKTWMEEAKPEDQKTVIAKFNLSGGRIQMTARGEVSGYILNQFSMDEYADHFRIATTVGHVWDENNKTKNNVYVLDQDLNIAGSLEDLAPGESIYSARFMGTRGYLVTFKKVDPLFVIDLANPSQPAVLGKLKIPGFSDYLHPYDATHLIGIGKETVEAAEEEKEQRNLDFAWYQGMKIAIFDVSDVNNPVEMHKEIIGDRGTDSPVLYDHKAFLFDRERNLMVLPIALAEIKGERTADNQYGEFVYQGAYVYRVTLAGGFELQGRITHDEGGVEAQKAGYYYEGSSEVKRSLYIDDVLYTLSEAKLKINSLDNLKEIKSIDFPEGESSPVEPLGI